MKVKVGQWVRRNQSEFYEVNESICRDCGNVEVIRSRNEGLIFTTCINVEEIIKVADTPQELVQVGDLVEFDGRFRIVREMQDDTFYINGIDGFLKEHIIAIYTPNADKTVFTQQWRKE